MDSDDQLLQLIFTGEGAVTLQWEKASRCDCYSADSRQPQWGHADCGGLGAVYAAPVVIRGLFRGQNRWTTRGPAGNRDLADAQLTVPMTLTPQGSSVAIDLRPGYADEKVRDRYRVVPVASDALTDVVFYPVAEASPFVFAGKQRAWRVKVQGLQNTARTLPQPSNLG